MGDAYDCHACGAGRPDDVEFYLPENAEVISDEAGIAAAEAGADIKCDYCGQFYAATEKDCPDCGGDGSKRHKEAGKVVTERAAAPVSTQDEYSGNDKEPVSSFISSGDHDRVLREHAQDPIEAGRKLEPLGPPVPHKSEWPPIDQKKVGIGFAIFAAILALGAGAYFLFRTHEVPAKLSHHSWERVQKVEEFTRGINRDGWDHPHDAYSVSTSQRIHHHKDVLDHYRTEPVYDTRQVACGTERYQSGTRTVNLGNGRFRSEPVYSTRTNYRTERYQSGTKQVPVYRKEPVYRTYYHYKVDRWLAGKSRVTKGLGLDAKWPPAHVRDKDQRMGGRSATYKIHFLESFPEEGEEARTWEKTLNETEWRGWEDNQVVILVVNSLGIREIRLPEAVEEGR
jgi:hypothetical protein